MASSIERIREHHAALETRFDRLTSLLERDDDHLFLRAPAVSGWSVAEQLHHTAAATGRMLAAVERIAQQKPPAADGGKVTVIGRAVLMTGRFPRGKGKAPKGTIPPEQFDRAELERALSRCRGTYDRIPPLFEAAAGSTFRVEHPYFGWLSAEQWLRLAAVHADHHFLIIGDIDAA